MVILSYCAKYITGITLVNTTGIVCGAGRLDRKCTRYPDDWVFTFLDGDGIVFDFGIDISGCTILKFYCVQNSYSKLGVS